MKKSLLIIVFLMFSVFPVSYGRDMQEAENPGSSSDYMKSILEAARSGDYPERRTSLLVPGAFDPETFEADPAGYLTTVEPGRIHQSAKPGPGVPTLRIDRPAEFRMNPGGELELSVIGQPNAPVTFHSTGLGAFDNRLTTMTVRGDGAGLASVVFTATAGTLGDVKVVAASPLAVGKVCFCIVVNDPVE